jgi:prepilin-type N-terminal cleavage/methylation domain-containing protein
MKFLQQLKRSRAFTLIEIMVVIAIISTLLVLASYSFLTIRNKIRKTSCRENMRQIYKAAVLCQTERSDLDNKNLTVGKLVELGYLRSRPKCPAGGSYSITDEDGHLKVSCFKTNNNDDHGFIQ